MRDPADIALIAQLESTIADLEHRIHLLCGDDASYHLLRPHGFNPRASKMLVMMAKQHPAVISRQSIRGLIGGDSCTLKSIDILVCKTRKVLDTRGIAGQIETIHGGGYRTDGQLTSWIHSVIDPPQLPEQRDLFDVA